MLDGLEVIEINFSEVTSDKNIRFEAEFYNSKTGLNDNFFYGEDIIDFVQYGTSNDLNEENLGYPILRLNEFESNFIGIPSKYCNSITQDIFENLRLLKNDVLICRTNGNPKYVGKSAIVMEDTQFAYASYLFKIRPIKEKINSSTLSIFLNSKYGRQEIEKYSMVSNQANFSPAKFKEIKIPIFSNNFQSQIENLIKTSYQKLEESKTLYKEAEELLLKELDLLDFKPSEENIATKSFKESFETSGRLDSEYYQPKYDEIIEKIKSYKGGFENLQTACRLKNKNHTPKENQYYQYVELSNIGNTGDITGFTYEMGQDLPSRARRLIKSNDVIISSIEGSLEKVALVTNKFDNSLCSTGFYVLDSKKINSETLLVLFKNKVFQQILKQNCSGTILTAINKDEFSNIVIPIIDTSIQNQIEEKIKKSFELKEQSKKLLDLAKRSVEVAIEKNEDEAIKIISETLV